MAQEAEQIKKSHISESSSSLATTHSLVSETPRQFTVKRLICPLVLVDQIGRLDPLPPGSKPGALQKRGVGLTRDVTHFACAFVPSLPEICAKLGKLCDCSGTDTCGMVFQRLTPYLNTEKQTSGDTQEQWD